MVGVGVGVRGRLRVVVTGAVRVVFL